MKTEHRQLIRYLLGVAIILALSPFNQARQAFAIQDGPNLIENGDFEEGFTIIEVADKWGHFQTDNAGIGFHDDMWDRVVFEGKHSQMIELADATSENVYAGIFQTVAVTTDQKYEFSFRGIVRSDEGGSTLSNSGYTMEYAVDLSGNQNWRQVTNWVELPWGEQPRTGPTFTMNLLETEFTAIGESVTIFIRARKRWANKNEGNFNIDDVRLVPIVPGRSPATGSFGRYHSHSALDASDGDPLNALFVNNDGKVGIGTTEPGDYLLRVEGVSHFTGLEMNGNSVATEDYVNSSIANKVDKTGDIMTGPLVLSGAPSGDLHAVTRKYVDEELQKVSFWQESGNSIYYDQGNVGIGVNDPQAKLVVAGTTRTDILEITGGLDLAEPFEMAGDDSIKPGIVVAIDPNHIGQLRIADKAYDRAVAGVVSGAGGINPGLTMRQEGIVTKNAFPVALTGRVYVWADASYGSIQPGDLLTTSDTPGHAMTVTDYAQAQGAILGKAMSSLDEGKGLVLVLVSLQ